MTFKGTNTYIIDNGELAIIDPGPINEEHFNTFNFYPVNGGLVEDGRNKDEIRFKCKVGL